MRDKIINAPHYSFILVKSELLVKESDSVDTDIEIRSRTVLGFMEITVLDYLGISLIICICVYICHIRIKILAILLEVSSIENVNLT